MKILVFSDSHRRIENIRKMALIEKSYDRAIHLGDSEGIENEIKSILGCPVDMVSGNCDYFSGLSDFLAVKIGKYKCILCHGHLLDARRGTEGLVYAAKEKNADYVFYGHTHIPLIKKIDDITVVNPGSISLPRGGFSPSYIVLNTNNDGEMTVEIKYID